MIAYLTYNEELARICVPILAAIFVIWAIGFCVWLAKKG